LVWSDPKHEAPSDPKHPVLMKRFYSHLGRPEKEALRLAKQELKSQRLAATDLSRGVTITGRDKKNQTGASHPFF